MRHLPIILAVVMSPLACNAQVPAPLGKCIVANVTANDRHDLARWVFLSMAAHPEVKQFSIASHEAAEAAARKVGALFTRTMRDECANEVQEAARAGGPPVVPAAINFFTQLGVQDLMTNRDVLATLSSFSQFADKEGIDRNARPK
ncbi:MAG: hypothetical protein ABI564_03245 [Ideonella sp.]